MDQAAKMAKRKKRARQIRLAVLAAVLLFVPLLVLGVVLTLNANTDLSQGTVARVTVSSDETTWEVTESEEIRFFIRVVQSGAEIDETAAPREEYRHILLTFHKLKRDVPYELLLSDSVNDCLYVDPQGGLRLIPAEVASELLVHPRITGMAISFASAPECTLSAGEKSAVASGAGEWTYTKVDGTLTTLQPNGDEAAAAVLPAGEDLSFAFSQEPDFVSIRLMDVKGTILYSGDPADMETLEFDDDTDLSLTVSAEWYESSGKTYRGKMDYTFDLFYDVPTLCTLNRTEALPGEVFEIRVAHASTESVAVTATFPTDQITTGREGKTWVIHVPASAEASPNTYSIVLLGSDVDQTFTVTILAPEE